MVIIYYNIKNKYNILNDTKVPSFTEREPHSIVMARGKGVIFLANTNDIFNSIVYIFKCFLLY